MTLSIADEFRTNTAAIVAQLRGFSEQPPHLQKVTLPAPFFSQIADKIEALEADAKAPKPCPNCGSHVNLFEIDTTRERPAYVAMERARIDRLNADDQRAAGQRECL